MLDLKQASFDFYILSSDRFIRFMTATCYVTMSVKFAVRVNEPDVPVTVTV